jgi:integral membrane sensor domain MASE1
MPTRRARRHLVTWWLRDAVGALVVAPVVVLWGTGDFRAFTLDKVLARRRHDRSWCGRRRRLSPLLEQTTARGALAFLAVLPLLWAALANGPRDTATAAPSFRAVRSGAPWRAAVRSRDRPQ